MRHPEPSTTYRWLCEIGGCYMHDGRCLNCGARDSVDPCPEWHCPDLSSEDRREGRTCPEHPCTCSSERESSDG